MPRRTTKTMTAQKFKEIRKSLGKTQETLASDLNRILERNYDNTKIRKFENGDPIPASVSSAMVQLEALGRRLGHVDEDEAMDCAILSVVNQKGGVGKTTVAVNLAYLLARNGARVLLIDADAQANASQNFKISTHDMEKERRSLSFALDFTGATGIRDCAITVRPNLDLVCGGLNLAEAELSLNSRPNGQMLLKTKLDAVLEFYEYIIIDCPPSLQGAVTVSAFNAADRLLVPAQTETFAMYGITGLVKQMNWVRDTANPGLSLLGFLPTLYKVSNKQDRTMLEQLHDWGREGQVHVFDPMPFAAVWARGPMAGMPTLEFEPAAIGSEVIAAIAGSLQNVREGRVNATA